MADRPFGHPQPLNAPQIHVLADGGDGVGNRLADGSPSHVMGSEHRLGVDVRRLVERDRENAAHQALKVIIAGHEIGLGIDLDHHADIVLDRDADKAVGGDAPAFLGGLGEAFLAQPVDGGLDIASRFGQRVLAVHHARAGLLAQILDQPSGDRSHRLSSHSLGPARNKSAQHLPSGAQRPGQTAARPTVQSRPDDYSAAISKRACSLQLSRAMRPLNLRSASSLAASSSFIAASCQ